MDTATVAKWVLAAMLLLPACSGSTQKTEHEDVPSRQLVTFQLSNSTASDLWLPLRGTICSELSIETATARKVQIVPIDGECCNCGATASFVAYTMLKPAEQTTVTWDAREFFEYMTGDPCNPTSNYAKPVAAGRYVAKFQVVRSAPVGESCAPERDGAIGCSECEPATETRAPFDLPSSGDVTVPVALGW